MTQQQARTPRLAYAMPTHVRAGNATRHRWGDTESGFVEDEVLISSPLIHSIIFTLPPRGSFVHSRENPTIFCADIVYVVLSGSLLLADPEHGQVVRAATGDALFFRRDTWHDGFNRESDPVRVLELFAPTPSTGASSAYARAQPFLERSRYGDDDVIGHWPELASRLVQRYRISCVRPADRPLRLEGDVLWGIIASTEHLHAATGELPAGGSGPVRRYGGDAVLHVTQGLVMATSSMDSMKAEHLLGNGDTLILPKGASLGLRCTEGLDARFILGVAPSYDETDTDT